MVRSMMRQNHFQCDDFRKKIIKVSNLSHSGLNGREYYNFGFISVQRKFKFLTETSLPVQELTSFDHKRRNKRICSGKLDYRWSRLCLISIAPVQTSFVPSSTPSRVCNISYGINDFIKDELDFIQSSSFGRKKTDSQSILNPGHVNALQLPNRKFL